MSVASATMTAALHQLAIANDAPRKDGPALGSWRWTVRQRMATVREALLEENGSATGADGWLAARGGVAFRERNELLGRFSDLSGKVLSDADVAAVRDQVARLVVDVSHHVQCVHDLAYDEVELELGGSD